MEGNTPNTPVRKSRLGVIFLSITAAFVLGAVGMFIYRVQKQPCAIQVDGKAVATVESRPTAKEVLAKARELGARGAPPDAVRFVEKVTIRRTKAGDEMTDFPEAVRALEKATSVEGELFAITVDDKPVAALGTEADADYALQLVKEHYEKNVKSRQGQSTFKEAVFVEKRYVSTDLFFAKPEDARTALTGISEQAQMHTVVRGDRAVKLAQRYNIPLAQLRKQNPDANMERLTEGDQLLIHPARRAITVVTKASLVKTVTVTPPQGAGGRTGKRTMRVVVTYENGQQVREEVISQITTWDRPAYSVERTSSRRRR